MKTLLGLNVISDHIQIGPPSAFTFSAPKGLLGLWATSHFVYIGSYILLTWKNFVLLSENNGFLLQAVFLRDQWETLLACKVKTLLNLNADLLINKNHTYLI